MVDIGRRKKLAFHLRHLAIGLITNDEFERNVTDEVSHGRLPEHYHRSEEAKSDDPIIRPMLELCWCLYDDTRRHKLTNGDKLSEEQLKDIARYILFLYSDFEYEWSYMDPTNPLLRFSFRELILTVLSWGKYYSDLKKRREYEFEQLKHSGDYDYWPFFRKQDFEPQLRSQPFLNRQEITTN